MQSHNARGTISVHLARFVVDALRRTGAGMDRFARFHDLGPEVLGNDLARVSTPSALSVWEELTLSGAGSAVGALLTTRPRSARSACGTTWSPAVPVCGSP
ncbi:hypothetical protein [Streptomyces virginiae]|uniref:hypothetical protein n=1 Tax=Streptomyces virginiae TaxID=1961 RepID=UPI000690B1AB|nr:hypothetical protein [Streptomyces virginiae]